MNEPFTPEQLAKAVQLNLRGKGLKAEDLTPEQLQKIIDQSKRELRVEYGGLKFSMPPPSEAEVDRLSKQYGGVIVGGIMVALGVFTAAAAARYARGGNG